MTQVHPSVLDAYCILTELRDDPPKDIYGICQYIQGLEDEQYSLIRNLMLAWPEGMGRDAYPVPGWGGRTADRAYTEAKSDIMWNPNHPYGAARLRLLDFLIEQLEAVTA